MSHPVRIALLLAIWLLAWGEVSLVNVLTGIAASALLLVTFPPSAGVGVPGGGIRPLALLKLGAHVVWQLVTSNLLLARRIVAPRTEIWTGVIEYALEQEDDRVLTIITNIIALSPGMMAVDVEHDPDVIRVHHLYRDDEEAHRAVRQLELLAADAFGRRP
jgi:multicomponent Na+:H+ antiporter subunit E